MSIGIYMIKNLVNNKIYIGQSINIENRLSQGHKQKLITNKHGNEHLQRSWNKYGEQNFIFSIIEYCLENELDEKEIYWINYYNCLNPAKGYNHKEGGANGRQSEETKIKIGKSLKGLKHGPMSEETKIKLSISLKGKTAGEKNYMYGKKGELSPNYGIKHSNEFCENISKRLMGHVVSLKTIKILSEKAKLKIGEKNSFYGKTHSKETKLMISNKQKENYKNLSEEEKEQRRNKKRNIKQSDESNLKRSKALKGRPSPKRQLTDEQVIDVLNRLNKNEAITLICEIYNVSRKVITGIKYNISYKHIERGVTDEK